MGSSFPLLFRPYRCPLTPISKVATKYMHPKVGRLTPRLLTHCPMVCRRISLYGADARSRYFLVESTFILPISCPDAHRPDPCEWCDSG